MEMFEKVEKLRARADVSFEEAKNALDACNGDLLDAMVYLEKNGKVKKPSQSTYSTSYDQQKMFTSVEEKVKSQQKHNSVFDDIRSFIKGFTSKCRGNYFCVTRNEEVKIKLPVLAFLLLLVIFWKITLPAMGILLFCGFRFSFSGKDELKEANKMMDKVGEIAQQVKDGLSQEATGRRNADSDNTAADNTAANNFNADFTESSNGFGDRSDNR